MLAPTIETSGNPVQRRRRPTPDPQRTKHRRTRSGCYTCRARRIKCDENRPTCERCRKGNRECLYPEPKTSKSNGSASASRSNKHDPVDVIEASGSSSDEYEGEVEAEPLETIPDEDDTTSNIIKKESISQDPLHHTNDNQQSIWPQRSSTRLSSEAPSLVQDKGTPPTPSTVGSVEYSATCQMHTNFRKESESSVSSSLTVDWSHLPPDLQHYLHYFCENLTYHHYSLKYDPCNFLKTYFLDEALKNEALLFAVVAFSSFQATLHNPKGQIQDFLKYYNKAVSLLLKSLKKGEQHSTGTLLAILQLATIEEYLGNWINLIGHQKAALEILMELYTPQTVMQTEMTRVMLGWYTRFDVFAGLMAGFETVLPRGWFSYAKDFYQARTVEEPTNLVWKIEKVIAELRLLAMDMSNLFAKIGKGEISIEQFLLENETMSQRISEWKKKMDPALQDPQYLVTDFTGARPLDPNDIVNPYIPGLIYEGPLWVINLSTLDWYSVDLMHKYQTALTLQTQPSPELSLKAYRSCQLFEAIQYCPGGPKGSVIAVQASLGIALLFLPRDTKHAMWARRKLATVESMGYIYPHTFRTKMSDLFQDRSCMQWWLPDNEGYPAIIRSIKNFVEERDTPAKDVSTEDLRDMKAIFASLKLDDGNPSQS